MSIHCTVHTPFVLTLIETPRTYAALDTLPPSVAIINSALEVLLKAFGNPTRACTWHFTFGETRHFLNSFVQTMERSRLERSNSTLRSLYCSHSEAHACLSVRCESKKRPCLALFRANVRREPTEGPLQSFHLCVRVCVVCVCVWMCTMTGCSACPSCTSSRRQWSIQLTLLLFSCRALFFFVAGHASLKRHVVLRRSPWSRWCRRHRSTPAPAAPLPPRWAMSRTSLPPLAQPSTTAPTPTPWEESRSRNKQVWWKDR